MVDYGGALGGAERFATALAAHMPRDRVEPFMCSTRIGDEGAIASLATVGVPHLDVGRTAFWQIHKFRSLVSLIRRERFDVIHAHKFGSNLWGTLIGRACRVPVVIAHEHNWSYSGNRLRVLIDGQLTGRLATRFVAVSAANRSQMIEIEGIDSNKIIVMPTAYIPQEGVDAGDIRAELGIEMGVPLVGVAAWLRPEKALEVMIDAHAKLSHRVPGVRLLLAGDGPCREQLEDRVARLGLGDRVHFLGPRRDIDAILRGVDAGAMSSDWEGMPLFVFECMANDTPLVATAVGGLPEVVRDGETGLLVAPRDPDALAGALERLLTDRAFAQRLAAAASARLAEFEIAAVASRFADLYEQLFAEASAR